MAFLFNIVMLGVVATPSMIVLAESSLNRCADRVEDWRVIVCGDEGRSSERLRGVEGGLVSDECETLEALTCSTLISATTAFGAAIPNPR